MIVAIFLFLFFDRSDGTWQLEPSPECHKAVMRMTTCPTCQGFADLKPCSNLCLNVLKGCLAYHADLGTEWDNYVGKTIKPIYFHFFLLVSRRIYFYSARRCSIGSRNFFSIWKKLLNDEIYFRISISRLLRLFFLETYTSTWVIIYRVECTCVLRTLRQINDAGRKHKTEIYCYSLSIFLPNWHVTLNDTKNVFYQTHLSKAREIDKL